MLIEPATAGKSVSFPFQSFNHKILHAIQAKLGVSEGEKPHSQKILDICIASLVSLSSSTSLSANNALYIASLFPMNRIGSCVKSAASAVFQWQYVRSFYANECNPAHWTIRKERCRISDIEGGFSAPFFSLLSIVVLLVCGFGRFRRSRQHLGGFRLVFGVLDCMSHVIAS